MHCIVASFSPLCVICDWTGMCGNMPDRGSALEKAKKVSVQLIVIDCMLCIIFMLNCFRIYVMSVLGGHIGWIEACSQIIWKWIRKQHLR